MGQNSTCIFITGAPRSGTTLCAQILNTHSRLTIFDELYLIQLGDTYERLRNRPKDDLASIHPAVSESVTQLIAPQLWMTSLNDLAIRSHSCSEFVRRLLPDNHQIDIWGEKLPGYFTRASRIKSLFPQSMIIFMVRHPAAVISSYLRYRHASERTSNDFWIADSTSEAIGKLEQIAVRFAADREWFSVVRYEDLVARPKDASQKICEAIGVEFEEKMLEYQPNLLPGSDIAQQFWRHGHLLPWKSENLNTINASLATRWKDENLATNLTDRDIERLRRLAELFNYEPGDF